MLSGGICRACRLRLSGSHSLVLQAQQQASGRNTASRDARGIGTSAAASTGAERSPPLSYRNRFAADRSSDVKSANTRSEATPSQSSAHNVTAGENDSSHNPDRPQKRLGEEPARGHPSDKRGVAKKKEAESQDNPPRRRKKKRTSYVPAGARFNIPPEYHDGEAPAPSRNIYSIIRQRWKIPSERSSSGFQLHHERTEAYIPILSQESQQWGYLRHQLTEAERPKAKKQLRNWYRRLGLVTVESQRLKARDDDLWLLRYPTAPAMCAAWLKLDVEERQRMWPDVMLATMLSSPSRAVEVLAATMSPLPPGYAITDVLHLVALNLKKHWPRQHREQVAMSDEILSLMEEVLLHVPREHMRPKQTTLGVFAKSLPHEHVKTLYELVRKSGMSLHTNAALHFASTLSKRLDTKDIALDIVLEQAEKGVNLNEPKVTSVITSLLEYKPDAPSEEGAIEDGATFSKRALEVLMEHGFVPNVINLTAFLDALCWHGEVDEAIRLALLFSESGAKLDGRTFSAIFKAAKESRDPEKMRRALEVAKAAKAPIVNVLNNALHSVFYTSEMEQRETPSREREGPRVFEQMLRLYSQRFSLEPLQWLMPDILPLVLAKHPATGAETEGPQTALTVAQGFFNDTQGPKLQPDATTLCNMLRAYIRNLRNPYDVVYFYEFFKHKLEDNDHDGVNHARDVVRTHRSLIHDTIILTMLERKLSTRQLLQVLSDMLRDNLPADTKQASEPSTEPTIRVPVHPAPTLFTLSILISRLLMRREKMVAQQLIDVMREQNIEPNLQTWNAMVKGYAVMQDVQQTVMMLRKLESAGFKPDDQTYRAFGQLNDQARALELMQKIIRENTARLARDEHLELEQSEAGGA